MSTTIDERVVEMRFDNKQFESNVSTSMSTLKKLKESLKFTGATKGLEEIESASKRVNMSGLGGAVDSVKAKFSALDVVAVTALANITNSAVNTGKRLVASLSVDQISSGWRKFGEKTTSVATLVAQGNAIEDVNKQLNLLNWFTDETSYNFTDMVSNIAKFTASGKGLDESVTAMEGIATWAALSGQNAMTASRAMYQLSQAMGAGVMRREDYRSIQNASMDTKEFRENCIEAAIALGTLKDNGDGTYSSLVSGAKQSSFTISQFADNLTDGLWLTSDVMMSVYTKYASAVNGIYEAVEEKGFDNASQVLTEIHDKADQLKTDGMSDAEAIDAAIKELGYTLEDGSLKFDHFGVKAFEAAQQARTFTDVIDSVKDAVSTGWMNTFEKIFGDSNQATELWTMMANELWDTFAGGGERRNSILDQALGSGWDKLTERITDAGVEVDAYESKVKELAKAGGEDVDGLITKYGSLSDVFKNGALDADYLKKALDSLSGVVPEVTTGLSVDLENILPGKYGETVIAWGSDATDAVTKIQTALTELGYELSEYGIDGKFGNETWKAVAEFQKNAGLKVTGQVDQKTLDALKEAGASIKTIGENSEVASVEIDDLLDSLSRPSGRELVFDIISNSLKTINGIIGAFREAWAEVFSEEGIASGIYNTLAAIRNFTEGLFELDEDGNKVLKHFDELKATFQGLISVLDLVVSIVGGAVKFAFKALGVIFGGFNLNILGATSGVGEFLIKLADIIKEGEYIGKAFDWLLGKFEAGVKWIKSWFTELLAPVKEIPFVKETASALKDLSTAFNKFKEGEYTLSDLGAAIKNTALRILNAVPAFQKWFDAFKETPVFQKWVAAFTEFQTVVQKFKNGEIGFSELLSGIGDFISKALMSIPIIEKYVTAIRNWFAVFKETPAVQKLVGAINSIVEVFKKLKAGEIDPSEFGAALGENLGKAISALPEVIKGAAGGFIEGARQIASDFIQGFQNGIFSSISSVISSIIGFCQNFVSSFASALGVQSPSWKAFEIAKDFFQGFINGSNSAISGVVGVLKKIGEKIVEVFRSLWDFITDDAGNVDWGKIFAGSIIGGFTIALVKFSNAVTTIAKAFSGVDALIESAKGVLDSFSGVLDKFGKVFDGIAWDYKAKALLKMAVATAILAGVMWVLVQIAKEDIGTLLKAAGILVVLAGVLVVLAIAMDKMSAASVKVDKNGASIDGLKQSLLTIAAALLILAVVVKILGNLDPTEATQGFKGLAGIAVGILVFVASLKMLSKISGDIDNIGATMLKISVAVLVLAIAMKKIANLDPSDIVIACTVLEMFVLFCVQLGIANRFAGEHGEQFGNNVIKIALAIGILSIIMKTIGGMDPEDIFVGIAAMQAMVILIGEMAVINRIAGSGGSKFGGAVMGMATSIMILTGVIWMLSMMNESAVENGIRIMQKFVLIVAEMVAISKIAGKESSNIAGNILAMSTAIGILAGIAILLSFIDISSLAKGIIAVGMLGSIMALMIWATRGSQDVKGNLITMTVAIGVMAAAVVALSMIKDGKKLAGAVAAMDSLMLAFAVMIKVAKAGENTKGLIATLSVMIGTILILAGIVVLLSNLKSETALPNALALSALMLALSVSFKIVSKAGKASAAINGALGLAAFIGVMAVIVTALGLLMKIPGFSDVLADGGKSLGLIGTAIGGFVGGIAGGVISGIGSAVLSLLPQLGVALSMFMVGATPFITLAKTVDSSVIAGAGYLAAAILVLSAANFISGVTSILTLGQSSFASLGVQLLMFGIGAKAFSDTISGIDASSIEAASNVASMILTLTASEFISGIMELFGGGINFEALGTKLTSFGEAVVSFSNTISGKIDTDAVQAATSAGELLAALNKSLPRSGGWVQDIIGEQDFGKFASACNAFATCILEINNTLSQSGFEIQSEKIEQLVTAGTQFSDLNNALPRSGGIAQDLAGEQDLSKFGEACTAFARCIISINDALSQDGLVIQSDKLKQLANAGTQFSDLNNALPKSGGIAQDLAGEQDLSRFGVACAAFATCMIGVNAAVSQEGFSVNLEAIDQLKQAGLKMKELQDALPKSGGWWQDIAGSSDIGDFGTKISTFATAIVDFSTNAAGLNTGAIDTVLSTAEQIKEFITDLSDLDTKGLKDFIGGFGSDGAAVNIAQCMSKFSKEVSDIDTPAVATSVTAATRLKALINALADLDTSGIENFKPGDISDALKSYSNTVASLNTAAIDRSIAAANKIKTFISSLSGFKTGGVNSFKSAVENLSSVNLSGISDMMTEYSATMQTSGVTLASSLNSGLQSGLAVINNTISSILSMVVSSIRSKASAFRAAGSTLASNLASGISSRRGTVASAASGVASSAASNARNYWGFYYAGSYCMDGLRDGINKNKYKVFNAVEQLAEDLSEKFRITVQIGSPSKLFAEYGRFLDEGLAIGIKNNTNVPVTAASRLGESTIQTMQDAISRAADMFSFEGDFQPTIRPVVDLSDVKTGVAAIDSMMLANRNVGLMADFRAISSNINARSQNRANDDIISAINKLGAGLENNRGDTYNFGDFTYDDGSEVADAVGTLIRYAKIGRRV